jgi:hypothetical protein
MAVAINNISAASEINTPAFSLFNNSTAPITEGTTQIIGPPAIKKVIHETIDGAVTKYGIYRNTAMIPVVMTVGTIPTLYEK